MTYETSIFSHQPQVTSRLKFTTNRLHKDVNYVHYNSPVSDFAVATFHQC